MILWVATEDGTRGHGNVVELLDALLASMPGGKPNQALIDAANNGGGVAIKNHQRPAPPLMEREGPDVGGRDGRLYSHSDGRQNKR